MISFEGRNRQTVNFLKTIYFDHPEWTLCRVGLMPATWMKYRENLEELVLAHPRIFPGYEKGTQDFDHIPSPLYELGRHTDCWGIVWENIEQGLDSIPVVHPLQDWSAFDGYIPPDPLVSGQFGPRDWEEVSRTLAEARQRGDLAIGGGLPHGFMYMLLFYLREFENLMLDLATEEPRLWELIRVIEDYNVVVIRKYLELGAEMMAFGEDLGLQKSLPISPDMWRRYIKPSYDRMFLPCRQAEIPIRMHTDGNILEIIPDLIEVGVTLLNPQIRANGLEGLQEVARGKVALDQDLDRQLFPFATPSQIEDHVGEVYEGLYLPEGGLMLYAECEPDLSLEQIEAICCALEKTCSPPLL
jgi:uroporphyrinogen decarboxylase